MSHGDKELTLATSRLLQCDLQTVIDRERASWRLVDSGIVAGTVCIPPKAMFFIVDNRKLSPHPDWTIRQRFAGGKFFRIELTIELEFKFEAGKSQSWAWARKYAHSPHIKCVMLRGDSFEHRYSSRGEIVCEGIYGLLDTPECTMYMAEKIRVAMNSAMATQSKLHPH